MAAHSSILAWRIPWTRSPVGYSPGSQREGHHKSDLKKVEVAQSCLPLCYPMLWNSLGQNTRVGSLSLLQGIFPAQESNPGLPHCRWILY